MLTLPEKILFVLASLAALYAAYRVADRIIRIIRRGHGEMDWNLARTRLVSVLAKTISLQPTFRIRLGPSLMHASVAWAFMFYLLVNLGDFLEAYIPGFLFLGVNWIGNTFRLAADVLSVLALAGMTGLMVRRFVFKPSELGAREDVMLHPKARAGIRRDSAVVGIFILVHVGGRFMGQSFKLASGVAAPWQPFAAIVANLWSGWSEMALVIGEHICFWLALGTILIFIPYFLYSKHIHLFFAPLNFLFKPERRSIGELSALDFEDESLEQFGVTRLEELGWEQLMDAYACIMCNRCQQVCPAYNTGKVLSPAALEINKRYFLNYEGARIANGEATEKPMTDYIIPAEAIWACTACGACNDICPVGNEPMRDILDMRRALVLMENDFPEQLQTAFRGMERSMNPWNIPPTERLKWAEGLGVPTIEGNPEPEILWWVGCAPATDARAQKTAQAFARILKAAGVNYAVLGENESCTGDSARRAGNEYLFYELALGNVEILNEVGAKRIVTTCPHCLHTLKNEYPAYGGEYIVVHHSQLINELVAAGKLVLDDVPSSSNDRPPTSDDHPSITFHDPCYLGRQNGVVEAPRHALQLVDAELVEMPLHGMGSFCCGAGGAQMWKEEEHGDESVNAARFAQAQATGADTLAVGCPFCMLMLTDAGKTANSEMQVRDIAELVAERISGES